MIINKEKPTLEASAEMQSTMFSIGDTAIIFDILRNKMYSSPITAICREISSNARDANIEAGKPNEPIQITLPNAIEPVLKIKDNGIGISPDRAEDIYVKYGSSTKRNTNDQVGYYGTGSKSPFSYSACWAVSTIHKGIKYDYSCVIDPSNIGKLIKLNETPTDAPSGTEISIPIKPIDFSAFIQGVEQTTRHFKPLPVIKGGKIAYQLPEYILEGTNWKIATMQGYSRQVRLIVAGVEYPLNLTELPNARDLSIFYDTTGDCLLYFDNGNLSLSASREQVHLDQPTIDKITARAKDAYNELNSTLQAKIDNCASLKEAYIAYASIDNILHNTKTREWKGIELSSTLYVPGMEEWQSGYNSSTRTSYLRFGEGHTATYPLYINDLQEKPLTKKQIAKLFDIPNDKNEKPSRVLIVNASSSSATAPNKWKDDLIKKVKDLHLEELDGTYLSEVISLDPEKPVKPRMTVFKFLPHVRKFGRVAYSDFEKDKNTKVLCSLDTDAYHRKERYATFNNAALHGNQINFLLEADKNVSIYGLDSSIKPAKIKQFFKGCKKIDTFINDKLTDEVKEQTLRVKAYDRMRAGNTTLVSNFTRLITNKALNASVKDILEEQARQQSYIDEHIAATKMYESLTADYNSPGYIANVDVDEWIKRHSEVRNCNQELEKALERYPLLAFVPTYGWDDYEADIVEYVRLVDERDAKDKVKKGNYPKT